MARFRLYDSPKGREIVIAHSVWNLSIPWSICNSEACCWPLLPGSTLISLGFSQLLKIFLVNKILKLKIKKNNYYLFVYFSYRTFICKVISKLTMFCNGLTKRRVKVNSSQFLFLVRLSRVFAINSSVRNTLGLF